MGSIPGRLRGGRQNAISLLTVQIPAVKKINGSFVIHCIITRLLKVKYEFTPLSIVAGIADGTTAAIVASGADWKSLIQVGLIMGVTAGVLGNYAGIAMAYLVKMLAGV